MATKRTYQPSKTRRARRHGFLVRSRTAWRTQSIAQPARERPAASRAVAAAAQALRAGCDAAARGKKPNSSTCCDKVRAAASAGYTFYLARREAGGARLGMLVSRKHAARAVERNRIKRCIREAFRLEQRSPGRAGRAGAPALWNASRRHR